MIRVAFATSDGATVNEHFARCQWFDIYELSPEHAVLLGSRSVGDSTTSSEESEEEPSVDGRVVQRVDLLRDCAILHVTSIGGAAAARVVNARIHPLKVPEGTPIADLNKRLCSVIGGNPPPWLRKVINSRSTS